MKKHFYTDGKVIRFGLADIKDIGEAQVEKLKQATLFAETVYGKKLEDLNWYEFLLFITPKISSTLTENMIQSGALNYLDKRENDVQKQDAN